MNETPLHLSDSESCFVHLRSLKYALAGDLESADALEALFLRWKTINWTDQDFIQFSEVLRAGTPKPTPEQEGAYQILHVIACAQSEHLAASSESIASALPAFRDSVKRLQNVQDYCKRLLDYTQKVIELYKEMRDRLEMLGDDVSAITLPALPERLDLS
jgi:hypothetical protein